MLGELCGGGGAKSTGQPTRNVHPLALHIGPGLAPAVQGRRIIDEGDADLLQNGLGVVLDDFDGFGGENLEIRYVPFDISCRFDTGGCPLGPARGATAAPPPGSPCTLNVCHIRHVCPRRSDAVL